MFCWYILFILYKKYMDNIVRIKLMLDLLYITKQYTGIYENIISNTINIK
jgi:hypothetical protein